MGIAYAVDRLARALAGRRLAVRAPVWVLAGAVAPVIIETVRREVRASADELADSLHPHMGRMISAYVASAIKDKAASGVSPTELAAFKAEMASMAEMYANPALRFLITLSEIAPVALIVPLISALVLRNSRVLPARD